MGQHVVWNIILQSQAYTSNLGAEVPWRQLAELQLLLLILIVIHPLPTRCLQELRLHELVQLRLARCRDFPLGRRRRLLYLCNLALRQLEAE